MDEKSSPNAPADSSSSSTRKAAAEKWLVQNADALESSNRFVERHGPPLQRYSCVAGLNIRLTQPGN